MTRLRPSPAACIATLALFVSLGGTTYAVTSLPRGSVGTPQLRARAVTEDRLANSAVVTRKLADGAVRGSKIARGSIAGSRIAANAIGGGQVDEAALAPVPRAQESDRALLAARASVADRVERIEQVARADSAGVADRATRADEADHAAVAASLGAVQTNAGDVTIEPSGRGRFGVACGVGLTPVGGGVLQTGGDGGVGVLESGPASDGWIVAVENTSATDSITVTLSAICIAAKQAPGP